MNIPCVLIVVKNSLLSFALTNLINASDKGVAVIESTARELDELIIEINNNEADVVLLDKTSSFASEEMLTKLLMMYPKLLLIVVNEENNWLHIYRRDDILMTSARDLLSAIVSARDFQQSQTD